jgi:hypothetical protein
MIDLDNEIEKRRAALSRAELTVSDTLQAPYQSEHTVAALAVLRTILHTEKAFLIELEKYRDAMFPARH